MASMVLQTDDPRFAPATNRISVPFPCRVHVVRNDGKRIREKGVSASCLTTGTEMLF